MFFPYYILKEKKEENIPALKDWPLTGIYLVDSLLLHHIVFRSRQKVKCILSITPRLTLLSPSKTSMITGLPGVSISIPL